MKKTSLNHTLSEQDRALVDRVWQLIRTSAETVARQDAFLKRLTQKTVLKASSFDASLARILSREQIVAYGSSRKLASLFCDIYKKDPSLLVAAAADLIAVTERDPAATNILYPFMHFKGFHALQTHRLAHWFWENNRHDTALYLQNRSSVLYSVDIHPAAQIGKGIMLDHAHNIVIGETAVVEDNVSMLHGTTLGGTGKERGDRHPKIGRGVMIGAGAKILGNIKIGEGSSVAAGSVVLSEVPPHTTVAGVPAKVVGKPKSDTPSREMDQSIPAEDLVVALTRAC
ncbi:MAG: serine O-acetyltransferase [Alphaproteobacteria bacterium]|nr:serine O-acetyltransferase [Alphaproteobacteria bacterium]